MNFWTQKIRIRNLKFPRFIGGPVDGLTDSPFRKIIRIFSKQNLLYTEIRHVRSIASQKGRELALKFDKDERSLNFQITANSTDFIDIACRKILQKGVDLIDLNIGCPARNVTKSGSGSALMSDLPLLEKILRILRGAVKDIPLTIKMRAGFREKNALDAALLAQDCGVDAIAIHPRLKTAGFGGELDYKIVLTLKKNLKIPVIWSGGIRTWEIARKIYELTGADGFMVSRALWGQPWILKQLEVESLGGYFKVDQKIILDCALRQLEYMLSYYGPRGLYHFRKNLSYYIKDKPSASLIRKKLAIANSIDEVKKGLISFLGR